MVNIKEFTSRNVTMREKSMFACDIEKNKYILQDKIEDKSVLVIGGAGSIGSSFIKALLPYEPKSLTVVDINENGLAELTRDLRSTQEIHVPSQYVTYPIDYSSKVFEKIFRNHNGYDIVANFSAHKHVRSEKDVFSIEALLRNNVLNAKKFLDLLKKYPPEEYFCVSTDKAANPVNVMGASKRIMEDLIFGYSNYFPVKTARFANVAFSNGSLPQGFIERIAKLQPISAPKDVKRYFVSLEESGQICLLACILGDNREIFFPKLHEEQMMTFDVIARRLLEESGYEVLECESADEALCKTEQLKEGSKLYPVHFSISDTSGEKQFEEFYTGQETVDLNRLQSLGVVTGIKQVNTLKIEQLINKLENLFKRNDIEKEDVILQLKEYLPNFKHVETGRNLDMKM